MGGSQVSRNLGLLRFPTSFGKFMVGKYFDYYLVLVSLRSTYGQLEAKFK